MGSSILVIFEIGFSDFALKIFGFSVFALKISGFSVFGIRCGFRIFAFLTSDLRFCEYEKHFFGFGFSLASVPRSLSLSLFCTSVNPCRFIYVVRCR